MPFFGSDKSVVQRSEYYNYKNFDQRPVCQVGHISIYITTALVLPVILSFVKGPIQRILYNRHDWLCFEILVIWRPFEISYWLCVWTQFIAKSTT
jgi:hypothetical protein